MADAQDSLKAATALMMFGGDETNNNANESLRAVTTLVTAMSGTPATSSTDSMSKSLAVVKLKATTETEKNELQRLNNQMKEYLDNVKRLEAMNRAFQGEVEKAKIAFAPKVMDKSSFNSSLGVTRAKLEEESMATVRFKSRIEASEILTNHITDRLKFFQKEAEIASNKLHSLQKYLNEMNNQKELLKRNAKSVEDDINKEHAKILQSEKDLEALLERLKDSRITNKRLEFEMQTLLDEVNFCKNVFNEEVNDMRVRLGNGTAFDGNDLSSFYKNELAIAVRQIREDFQNLNDSQLREYKKLKDDELNSSIAAIENDKSHATRTSANKDLEVQGVKELSYRLDESKGDLGSLNRKHNELSQKLSALEVQLRDFRNKTAFDLERKQGEIEALKMQNDQYANELHYWDKVTRTKLESEIQTYRSILNSQIKLLESVTNSFQAIKSNEESKKPAAITSSVTEVVTTRPLINEQIVKRPAVVEVVATRPLIDVNLTNKPNVIETTKITTVTQEQRERNEMINILRQVFEYFDSDRSGKINSNEFDQILAKLNVKLSREAYQKMLRENDLDNSRDIDFNEFIKIMLPVFTGRFEDEQLWFAFQKFDKDGSGYITTAELKSLLAQIGQQFSEKDIARMIASVDNDGDGRLSFKEFVKLMKAPTPKTVTTTVSSSSSKTVEPGFTREIVQREVAPARTEDEELYYAFQKYDQNGSGYITITELKGLLTNLGFNLTERQVSRILASADSNKDGRLNYQEFVKLMKSRNDPEPTPTKTTVAQITTTQPGYTREIKQVRTEEEEYYHAFQQYDKNGSGYITISEFSDLLTKLGYNLTERQVSRILSLADGNNDGKLSYQEFVKLMKSRNDPEPTPIKTTTTQVTSTKFEPGYTREVTPVRSKEDEQLFYFFQKYDKNGSGYITISEFRELLSQLGHNLSEREVSKMLAAADINNDGRLSFQEFCKLMKSPSPVEEERPKTREAKPYETYETAANVKVSSQEDKSRNETIKILKQVFDFFDSDRSGKINSSEFDKVLEKLNVKLSKEVYNKIIKEADMDLSRDIDFNEFCRIMLPVFSGQFEDEQLYKAFKKFDTDNSGYILTDELKQILAKIGQHYSDKDIAKMVSSVDKDGDGRLSFPEFVKLMKQPSATTTSF